MGTPCYSVSLRPGSVIGGHCLGYLLQFSVGPTAENIYYRSTNAGDWEHDLHRGKWSHNCRQYYCLTVRNTSLKTNDAMNRTKLQVVACVRVLLTSQHPFRQLCSVVLVNSVLLYSMYNVYQITFLSRH